MTVVPMTVAEEGAPASAPLGSRHPAVIPYLVVHDAARLLDYMQKVFGAAEIRRSIRADGSIAHAEVRIDDSIVMIGGAHPDWSAMPSAMYVYVKDTDLTYERALELGAKSLSPPADQGFGDRNAGVQDPTGHFWWIATHREPATQEPPGPDDRSHQRPDETL
jgi:PhnB protein